MSYVLVEFGIDSDMIEWLNKFVLADSKEQARVIEEHINSRGQVCRLIYPKDIEALLMHKKWDVMEWL